MRGVEPIVIEVAGKPVPFARAGGRGAQRFTPSHVRAWRDDVRVLAFLHDQEISYEVL